MMRSGGRPVGAAELIAYMSDFLQGLSRRLRADGYAETAQDERFIRSIQDRARLLRREAQGYGGGGGGGSGSDP
jgi:hypothetical protein